MKKKDVMSLLFVAFLVLSGTSAYASEGALRGHSAVSVTESAAFSRGDLPYQSDRDIWSSAENQWNLAERGNGTLKTVSRKASNNRVTVEPAETSAVFTWPTDSAAHKYQIDVYKDGAVFCKLTLGSKGQLSGISFSIPGRRAVRQEEEESTLSNTLSFMVTGLDAASRYNYVLSVLDENEIPLHVYIGDFATTGYNGELKGGGDEVIPTPPIVPGNPEASVGTGDLTPTIYQGEGDKVVINGQVYILYKGKRYDVTGR